MISPPRSIRIILASIMLLAAQAALASTVTLGGSGALTLAASNSDSSHDVDDMLSSPGTYTYGNSYAAAAGGTTFYDSFIITVPQGQLDAITTSIELPLDQSNSIGVQNLNSRLFQFTPGPGVAIPTTGPASGIVKGWTSVVFSSPSETGYVNVLVDPGLAAGTYVFQIEGTLLAGGGSYGGDVNLSPVPLGSSLVNMLLGLTALGGTLVVKKRKVRASHGWHSSMA
jgi:hypothetical protein